MKLGPKLRLAGLTLFAMGMIAAANAALTFSTGTGFLPGFRTIDGTDLNVLVTALNNITGGGTAAPVTASTLNATGATTLQTTAAVTGVLTPTGGIASSAAGPAVARGQYTCSQGALTTTTPGTDTTPVNTETYIAEVFVDGNQTITGVAMFNGSAVAGNVTISLANATTGVPIAAAKSASTAQSGTGAYQLVPFATPYAAIGPATYLVLMQFDTNTTPRFRTHAIGTCGASKKTGETYGTFTTVTPPTTFTTAVGPIAGLY